MRTGRTRIAALLVSAAMLVLLPPFSRALSQVSNRVLGDSSGRASGIQVASDDRRVLISKDVGDERWSITRNLDDLTVTGNVFFPGGGAPLFVFCEQNGQSGDDLEFSCFGADACSESACPEFEFIADVTLPESFFTPPSGPVPSPGPNASTIRGRVRDVVAGAAGARDGMATPSQVDGIAVELRQGGVTLASTTTDVEGRFILEFEGGGAAELTFAIGDVLLTLTLDVLPGSVVTLEVELRVTEERVIVVDNPDVDTGPIRCETGVFEIFEEELDLVIDGDGEDCLRAENDCVIDILARSVTLIDCERCITAESSAEITVESFPGGVVCESRSDGIRAESSSVVVVQGSDGVEIASSTGSGIRAESSAQVLLASDGTCFIEGFEDAIRVESQALVDVEGCADVVLVGDSDDDDEDDDDD
jgi:hypothetical protein